MNISFALVAQTATILEMLCQRFGKDTPIAAIDPDTVARAAAQRARTTIRKYNRRTLEVQPTSELPTPSSVNRQIIDPIRRLLRRAKKAWRVPIDLEQFDWGALMYAEPAERVRELSVEEEQRLWLALREDYHPLVEIYIISGRRRSDWIGLKKFKIDRTAGTARFPTRKRKEQGARRNYRTIDCARTRDHLRRVGKSAQ